MRKDATEFEDIYRANFDAISKHILMKIAHVYDAQDLTQDVFYDFYKYWLSHDEPIQNVRAYLKQIANHRLSTYYASHKKENTLIFDEQNRFESIQDPLNLEKEILETLTLEEIFNEIETYKEPDRSLLVARFRFDISYRELAEGFELAESTIKSIVQRHLKNLQDKFSSKHK